MGLHHSVRAQNPIDGVKKLAYQLYPLNMATLYDWNEVVQVEIYLGNCSSMFTWGVKRPLGIRYGVGAPVILLGPGSIHNLQGVWLGIVVGGDVWVGEVYNHLCGHEKKWHTVHVAHRHK